MSRKRLPSRGSVVSLGLAMSLFLSLWSVPSHGQDKTREQKIADLEKQIQAINKELDELKSPTITQVAGANPAPVPEGTIPSDWIKALTWRSIGPANMGGRVTGISVLEADPTTYWVATASGGLLKTVNNGITFDHQFDHEATVSIGAVCVGPSDSKIVWVGTGENNPRNSVSYGDGVYKSTDGGKTWKNMGLKQSFQIGSIKVNSKNPDIVYVGALGRLYGPSTERGLFKTSDGGKTWDRMLYIDEQTGIIDIQMHPTDPDTLLVATWNRLRDEFDNFLGEPPPPDGIYGYDPIRKYGKGGGIFKTTDGGKNFHKLTNGLPGGATGRIGMDYYRKNPNVVFAIIDSEKAGTGPAPIAVSIGLAGEEAAGGLKLTTVLFEGPSDSAGLKKDDLLVSLDGKPVPDGIALVELLRPHKVNDKVKAVYQRGSDKKEVSITLAARQANQGGGRGQGGGFAGRGQGGGGGRGQGGGGFGGFGGRGGAAPTLNLGFFATDAEDGALILNLAEQSDPAKAGLKTDDLITAIDGKPVEGFFPTLATVANAHKAGDKIKLAVTRGEQKLDVTLPLLAGAMQGGGRGGRGGRGAGEGAASRGTPRPWGVQYGGQAENVQDQQGPDGYQTGGLFKSVDGGETWKRINSINVRPMYFSQVRVDPTDEKNLYVLGIQMYESKDGGRTFRQAVERGVHDDRHAMWIDPHDGRHQILGCDGGFYQTYDRGANWDHLNHLALGQFYHVAVDPRPIYRVLGGLQDNGSWAGPARTLRASGPINEDWIMIGGGDGFVCRVDPKDPDLVYSESQDGSMQRRHLKTGESARIRPLPVQGKGTYRFNWNTPFILSSHNPSIYYCGAQYVFRSTEHGDHLRIISPEITRTKHGSATAIAESPRNSRVLYAGTDDGALWVTRDGGGKWTDISANVKLPGPRWVTSIEPSRYTEGRVYVAFDAHRSNDDEPYVFASEDFGETWKSIRANLPIGSTRVCREDIQNADMLYCGTEFAAWVSANRGASWTKLNNNLPTVAVHEFAQHPTSGEIVAATHGRSLWVLDVTPLRQMTAVAIKDKAHLFQPNTVVRWRTEQGNRTMFGGADRKFFGENPPNGAQIYYSLSKAADTVTLKVMDYTGRQITELRAENEPGLHHVAWNFGGGGGRGRGAAQAAQAGQGGGRGGRRGGAAAAGGGGAGQATAGAGAGQPAAGARAGQAAAGAGTGQPPAAAPAGEGETPIPPGMFGGFGQPSIRPGVYRVVLDVDGKEFAQWVRIEADPSEAGSIIASPKDDDDP